MKNMNGDFINNIVNDMKENRKKNNTLKDLREKTMNQELINRKEEQFVEEKRLAIIEGREMAIRKTRPRNSFRKDLRQQISNTVNSPNVRKIKELAQDFEKRQNAPNPKGQDVIQDFFAEMELR